MKSFFRTTILPISSLLMGIVFLVLGNGLQGTLLGVRAGLEGMSEENIGLFMSAYFIGYASGPLLVSKMVRRFGHVRIFAALASLTSVISLAHLILISPWAWTLFRAVHGLFYAGLVLVVESWLNSATEKRFRGRVLSIYGIIILLGMGSSQLLLNLADPQGFILFCLVSIFLSLALVPVTLSRVSSPQVALSSRLSLKKLYAVSPTGITGIFCVGLYLGAFYGMAPTFAQQVGLDTASISFFMGLPAAGALLLQWPLGWLSDLVDRRLVILISAAGTAATSFFLAENAQTSGWSLYLLVFLFGGLALPAYSLCIAHTNDYLVDEDFLSAASGLILVYGIGASVGPFLASLVMGQIGPGGLFWMIFGIQALFAAFAVYRLPKRKPLLRQLKEALVHLPRTSPVIYRMDRRRSDQTEWEKSTPGEFFQGDDDEYHQ